MKSSIVWSDLSKIDWGDVLEKVFHFLVHPSLHILVLVQYILWFAFPFVEYLLSMWHMLNFHFWCDKRIKKSIKHQHPGEPLTTYCELLYAQKNSILYQVNSTIFDLFICPDLLYISFVLFVANQMYEWRMFKPWKLVRAI